MGVAFKLPYKSMKSKTGMKNFATDLSVISKLLGADGTKVLKNLSKQVKDADGGKTTMKQIESNGVKYNINLATKDVYFYITK
jgi:hypothetical protein